jgi:putative FmdB family regulatory protein
VPIYEYVCQSCAYRFEVKQRINDAPLAACERCGQPVVKVISPPAIMFKGSGWYVTDYSDKLKPPGQSESAGKPSNGKSDAAAGEPKKEATPGNAPAPAAAPASAPAGSSSSSSGGSASGSGSSAPSSPSTGSSS